MKSFDCVRRAPTKSKGETIVDIRYFIAGVTGIAAFSKSVRAHRQAENKLHWHRDYTFTDDQNTAMQKHGARDLQTVKRLALAILSLVQSFYDDQSLKKIRYSLSLEFENTIEKIFKLLNAEAIAALLPPRSG